MISVYHIRSIAKYEVKTLSRSWFFRIFGILSLVFLFFFNLMTQTNIEVPEWNILAIPAGIPYANLLILNVAQAIIAVFLASDFLKRDKKLDTTEVIYMRSMTNGDYVIGKTLGNLIVFFAVNFAVLLIAVIFNMAAKGHETDFMAYIYYLLLISLPTLTFILGASFLLMSIIRNQAITFILLLGYIALTLFYLQNKVYYLFDYMAFNIPLMKSEFVGFSNLDEILVHRGIYFFLGLGFISLTIFLLKRLPQSRGMNYISLIFGILAIVFSIGLMNNHIQRFRHDQQTRDSIISLNNQFASEPVFDITRHNISLQHTNKTIEVDSKITLQNNNNLPADEIILNLNPGLVVESIHSGADQLEYLRKQHLIIIQPGREISPADTFQLTIKYLGSIDESYCYLDIDEETRQTKYGPDMFNIPKKYSFISPEYVLLTQETGWYPRSGVTYSSTNPHWLHRDFTEFTMDVQTSHNIIPVSQGKILEKENGWMFSPEHPLPQISLAIGPYERKTIDTNNIQFSVYYKTGHDFFSGSLPEIVDTISAIIFERFEDYQRNINLSYPFSRFNIVETPVQFASYNHVWSSGFEIVQPEIIFFPEKGILTREVDFVGQVKRFKRRSKWSDETSTDKQYQVRALNEFCNLFINEMGRPNWQRGSGRGTWQPEETLNHYYIFPVFYNFSNYIESENWPILNRIVEAYLQSSNSDDRFTWMRDFTGVSEDEKANMALQYKSFSELLLDKEQKTIIDNIIKLKGEVLFSIIKTKAGQEEFDKFLYDFFTENLYRKVSFEEFNEKLYNEFNLSLDQYMDNWFSGIQMPGFLFSPIIGKNVKDGERILSMVQFKVSNLENADGVIKLRFRLSSQGGRQGKGRFSGGKEEEDNTVEKVIYLEKGQTKELSYLFDNDPRMMTIYTLTSKNIPSVITKNFPKLEDNFKVQSVEYERLTDNPVRILEENEIIIDNEDPEFSVIQPESEGLLIKLLFPPDESDAEYTGFRSWRAPINWTPTTNSAFYGKYIRSASYVRSGSGDRKAIWKVPINKTAYYDVYYYIENVQQRRSKDKPKGEYQFVIHHNNGTDEPALSLNNDQTGWNHLGSYYFSPDTAIVELTNNSESRVVVADAIKFVKQ